MYVTAPPLHTSRGLSAVFGDVAKFLQIKHCVKIFWALGASTLIITWHKFMSLKMPVDLAFFCSVTRKSGSFWVSP
jgi:hypothetical protein